MNIRQIVKAAKAVHRLIDSYSGDSAKKREMRQDPLLYGYFEAKFGNMSRQKYVFIGDGNTPKRIDFRYGGTNPVVIEFAVRPPHGGPELYGSQNRGELNKLTRIPNSRAVLRILLLLDFYREPHKRQDLKESYDIVRTGPGRYQRSPVQIIYIHKDITYRMLWRP